MEPDSINVGDTLVVAPDPLNAHGQPHTILDAGDIVRVVNATPDGDGEIFVNAEAEVDDATVAAFIQPQYLMTVEDAKALCAHDCDEEEWETIGNLPAFKDVPLGYALGLMAYVSGAMQQISPVGSKPPSPPGFPIHVIGG